MRKVALELDGKEAQTFSPGKTIPKLSGPPTANRTNTQENVDQYYDNNNYGGQQQYDYNSYNPDQKDNQQYEGDYSYNGYYDNNGSGNTQ